MTITVVIPMAGAGSRFQKEGWETPKPLIEFNGKMMIEHVLDSFSYCRNDLSFILIIRSEFRQKNGEKLSKLEKYKNLRFIEAEELTQGAACTVLLARKYFANSSLLIADSDTFYSAKTIGKFVTFLKDKDPDVSLITFMSQLNCYSYVSVDEKNNLLTAIAEKEVISSHAISGIYYFKYGAQFVDTCIELLIYNRRTKSEFYISSVVGEVARKLKSKFMLYEIEASDIFCAGTPSQLKNVVRRINGLNLYSAE